MNRFRTISRVLVVTAVVVVSAARADLMNTLNEETKQRLGSNKFTATFALIEALECKKDEHAKKALIDTLGHALDNVQKYGFTVQEAGKHGLINYLIRKGTEYLHQQGISVNALANTCDVLPEGMIRDKVNPIVKTAAEVAMHPEVIMYVGSCLLPKSTEKNKKETL